MNKWVYLSLCWLIIHQSVFACPMTSHQFHSKSCQACWSENSKNALEFNFCILVWIVSVLRPQENDFLSINRNIQTNFIALNVQYQNKFQLILNKENHSIWMLWKKVDDWLTQIGAVVVLLDCCCWHIECYLNLAHVYMLVHLGSVANSVRKTTNFCLLSNLYWGLKRERHKKYS